MAMGRIGTAALRIMIETPRLNSFSSPSSDRVPSGKTSTTRPALSSSIPARIAAASAPSRLIGIVPRLRISQPNGPTNRLARPIGENGRSARNVPQTGGS